MPSVKRGHLTGQRAPDGGGVTLALPLEAAIDRASGPPADVVNGLDLLARSRPVWPLDATTWRGVVGSVSDFAARWDGQALEAGWSTLELYGLHRSAPWANLSAMGAAFVLARSGYLAIAVTDEAIVVRSALSATLRIRRFALNPDAVLAWSLCRDR
jgi:hypothetical protein